MSQRARVEPRAAERSSHHRRIGLRARLLRILARGGHTVDQLAEQTGINHESVRNCINQLCNVAGGVEGSGPASERIYHLFKAKRIEFDPDDFSVAQPIAAGYRGYKWGSRWGAA